MVFHYKDGWYFERTKDNSVRIFKQGTAINIFIDSDSWCSIIASVAKDGETSENWEKARSLHFGDNRYSYA